MRAGRQSSGGLAVVCGWAMIALLSAFGLVGLANRIEFGPHVGDIVAFDPAEGTAPDVSARVTVATTNGGACTLDLGLIEQGGGSLVIEARRPDRFLPYQVHWAGPLDGDADCGRSADLLVGDSDMTLLAMAAGGYGVRGRRLFVAPLWTEEAVVR